MQKTLKAILALITLLIPQISFAVIILSASDTIAGLGTQVNASDLTADSASVIVEPPYGPEFTLPLPIDERGVGSIWIPGNRVEMAGTYKVSLEGEDAAYPAMFTVHPDTMDASQSAIETDETTFHSETTVSVILRDQYGNPLEGRPVELISSRPADRIASITQETDARGEQIFSVRASKPGSLTLRARDMLSSKVLENEVTLQAGSMAENVGGFYPGASAQNSGASKEFYPSGSTSPFGASVLSAQVGSTQQLGGFMIEIRGQESEPTPVMKLNDFYSMTITALDQNGDRYFDYEGTVYLLSTDPMADLPKEGAIDFAFRDQGVKQYTLGLSFHSPSRDNMHTLIITDHPSEVRTILAELDVEVTGGQGTSVNEDITITNPTTNRAVNSLNITIEGVGPPFINIRVTGGKTEVSGGTDREGRFSVPIELDGTKSEHTIQVFDTDGRSQSQQVKLTVDNKGPEIKSMTFTPPSPKEETDVLLVVESEADLAGAKITINNVEHELRIGGDDPTKYQVLFTAPTGGIYNPILSLTDGNGNVTEQTTTFAVGLKGLPKVQNVQAESQTNAISLRWDPVAGIEIDGYRVYVGTSPDEFIYTLDTDRPTAAATVAGLQPGNTYFFAVTAFQEERESEEKSEIVSATVFGVKLKVTPQDGALMLEWNSLQRDTPLSMFMLEYGTEPDQYTEQRTLTGELRTYTLRDLLNGVTYYMKLTPVATTGDKLEELSTTGQGTPTGRIGVFKPGATDPVPFEIPTHSGAPRPPNPPTNTDTGLPLPAMAGIAAGSLVLFLWYMKRRRELRVTTAFLQSMESRYYR